MAAGSADVAATRSTTATTLADGRILVVGGSPAKGAGPSAATEIGRPRREPGRRSRGHDGARADAAIRLVDGRVVIAGGALLRESFGPAPEALAGAEVWDPRTNRWTDVSPMHFARSDHDAVLLADGRVLVAGVIPMWAEIWTRPPTAGRPRHG